MIDAHGQGLLFPPPPPVPGVDRAHAIARRTKRERSRAHNQRIAASQRQAHAERRGRQDVLPLLIPFPSSTTECRSGVGPVADAIAEVGVCPVMRCRYNLALWVRDNGSIKVEAGHVRGGTLHHNRRVRGESIDQRMDRMADLVVELADRLGTLCLWDILPAAADASAYDERRPFMSYEQIGKVLAQSKEAARKIVDGADESADFAQAKLRREQMRARKEVARLVDVAAQGKRGRARDQLVQIRPRPPR